MEDERPLCAFACKQRMYTIMHSFPYILCFYCKFFFIGVGHVFSPVPHFLGVSLSFRLGEARAVRPAGRRVGNHLESFQRVCAPWRGRPLTAFLQRLCLLPLYLLPPTACCRHARGHLLFTHAGANCTTRGGRAAFGSVYFPGGGGGAGGWWWWKKSAGPHKEKRAPTPDFAPPPRPQQTQQHPFFF